MNTVLQILSVLVGIAALVSIIIILVDAFKNAIWKGVLCLICCFYWVYYALFEFQHKNKWPIVILAFFSTAIEGALQSMMYPTWRR